MNEYKTEAERQWDERADRFNEHQKKIQSGLFLEVLRVLREKEFLTDAKILDIAGGSGRYAIPFAKEAREVVMTDISGKMLQHAENNAKEENLSNIRFEKADWADIDLNERSWHDSFDLVFASMSPPLRSDEGLRKMVRASRKHGFIHQIFVDTDSIVLFLEEQLGIRRDFDPHNDRPIIERFFRLLWEEGADPIVQYAEEASDTELSEATALETYGGYEQRAMERGTDLRKLLQEYRKNRKDGLLMREIRRKSAMISWTKASDTGNFA